MRNDFKRAAQDLFGGAGVGASVRPYRGVGASVRRYRVGAPAVSVPQYAEPGVEYSPDVYTSGGNSLFGLGQRTILAGATQQSELFRPIRPFNPMAFRMPSTVIGLLVVQIDIQGVLYFANSNDAGVPVELLSEVSTMKDLGLDTIDPASGVTITLANPTAGDLVFSGSFWGTQVRR